MPSVCSIVIQILKFPFWLVNNSSNIEGKIFSLYICQKCVICCQKTWCWCQVNLKFCTQANYLMPRKNLKITFLPEAPNMVKMESEIYKYFSYFFSLCKIFDPVLKIVFNSSPKFHSHPVCRLLGLQLILFVNLAAGVDCVQLAPKYYSKVKLRS